MSRLPIVIAASALIGGFLHAVYRASGYPMNHGLVEGLAEMIFLEDAMAWFGQGAVLGVIYLTIPLGWLLLRRERKNVDG